ncbi:MAG: type I phosphomannose isomerase catalytic subunit [Kiritimatiellia bacterium]
MNLSCQLYPLRLQPAYQRYIWGGDRIPKLFRRNLPPGIYAESWEVSDRAEAPSVVADGPLRGCSLTDLMRARGAEVLGAAQTSGRCPWLIKLIDACRRLSVQVHPDSQAAAIHGGEPKTEAWYVLEVDEKAAIYAGFKPGVNAAVLQRALADNAVEKLLEKTTLAAGDLIYVPGGLVHAIGAGCLLLEVQQNSNTTYRVYDWGRVGADGQPRELHVEQALHSIKWEARPEIIRTTAGSEGVWQILLRAPFFEIDRLSLSAPGASADLPASERCQALFVVSGAVRLTAPSGWKSVLSVGSSVLIPAVICGCRLETAGGSAVVVRVG